MSRTRTKKTKSDAGHKHKWLVTVVTVPIRALRWKRLRDAVRPLAGKPQTFSARPSEKQVAITRKMEKPSVWATKYRMLRSSAIPGPWKHTFTPYLAPLMDACRYPGVETGIICKTPQTGGSEACLNLLGHAVDHYPGPAMVVYPDRDTAKDVSRDRMMQMFQDSPRLRKYLTGNQDDEAMVRVNLRHMVIYMAWAGSVSRLGSRPIRTLILDELDKYPKATREAQPEALAEKRTITWADRGRLIMKISTPTTETGPIWVAFTEEAQARFDWRVTCPDCGAAQVMKFEHIHWPDGADAEAVGRDKSAYYACEHCGVCWDDEKRNMAVRKGQWVERETGLELFTYLDLHKPTKIGFHIPAWISYFVSLSAIAAAYLKWQKSKRLDDFKDFATQYKAEPWTEIREERKEDDILAHCDERPRGLVPSPLNGVPQVAALVAGIDTQAHDFRYVIRAFGYGPTEESWLIQHGRAPTFAALDELLWRSVYEDGQGNKYRVRAAVIDAMGTQGTTKAVYAWCAKHKGQGAMPYQGKQSLASIVGYTPIDFVADSKGNKIRIPGGVVLRRVDTTFFKGDLSAKLLVKPGDPGSFWLHSDVVRRGKLETRGTILDDYAKEMCAEVYDPEKGAWVNPKNRPNHYWDCEVMALVAAFELHLRTMEAPTAEAERQQAPRPGPGQENSRPMSTGARIAALLKRRRR